MKKRPNPATAHTQSRQRGAQTTSRSSALVRGWSTHFIANPCRWPQRRSPETSLHFCHFRGLIFLGCDLCAESIQVLTTEGSGFLYPSPSPWFLCKTWAGGFPSTNSVVSSAEKVVKEGRSSSRVSRCNLTANLSSTTFVVGHCHMMWSLSPRIRAPEARQYGRTRSW